MPKRGTQVCLAPRQWSREDAAAVRSAVESLYGPGGSFAAVARLPTDPANHSAADREVAERFAVDRLWLDEAIETGVPTPRRAHHGSASGEPRRLRERAPLRPRATSGCAAPTVAEEWASLETPEE